MKTLFLGEYKNIFLNFMSLPFLVLVTGHYKLLQYILLSEGMNINHHKSFPHITLISLVVNDMVSGGPRRAPKFTVDLGVPNEGLDWLKQNSVVLVLCLGLVFN